MSATKEQLDFASEVMLLKEKAGRLKLWRTMHALEPATQAIGWELADIESGEQPGSVQNRETAMTEDRDPLDDLKLIAAGVDPEHCSPFQAMTRETCIAATAAWEKERANFDADQTTTLTNAAVLRAEALAVADRVETIVHAFNAGDSRRDDIRALAARLRKACQ